MYQLDTITFSKETFNIYQKLGAGITGTVYKGINADCGNEVALKVIEYEPENPKFLPQEFSNL